MVTYYDFIAVPPTLEWFPTDIDGCVLWLPSNYAWEDAAKTNPCENDTLIWVGEDKSLDNDVVQATEAARPVYLANGYSEWVFDGVDDELVKATYEISQPYTMFFVFSPKYFTENSAKRMFCLNTGIGGDHYIHGDYSTQLAMYAGGTILSPHLFKGLVPAMTANNAPSPYVASASEEGWGTYYAWQAFDKVGTTLWHTENPGDHWLKIDLGSAKICRHYAIHTGSEFHYSTDFLFQGSNNDSDWTTLDTQSGLTWSSANETKSFNFTNETAYRYYRLYITGGPTAYKAIANFYLSEYQNVYYKVVAIYDGANSKLRVDGIETAGNAGTGGGARIGLGSNGQGGTFFTGRIREAGIYNKALNVDEIALLEAYLPTSGGN